MGSVRGHRGRKVFTVLIALLAVVWPFTVVHYPPLTDLPAHASNTSILRHYFDPAFHFREQFEFAFLESPYVTVYALGAFFELFLSPVVAMKLVAIVMLLLLPAGLAVLFAGMKRSPEWGLLGLAFVWTQQTFWGFMNSMGALGLYAATIGVTLFLVDHPTRKRQALLAFMLVLTFYTHAFRYPFTAGGVLLAAAVMYPATRNFSPVLLPSLPAAALCATWLGVRPKTQAMFDWRALSLHWDRFLEIRNHTFHTWTTPLESSRAAQMFAVIGAVLVASTVVFLVERRHVRATSRDRAWAIGTTVLVVLLTGTSLIAFLVLPMKLGTWWMVYPREITSAGYIALALMPALPSALPRARVLAGVLLAMVSAVVLRQASLTAAEFSDFDRETQDFQRITRSIPDAPKLLYLIADGKWTRHVGKPYPHFAAWVQAEKGGWLHYHTVLTLLYPIRYRDHSPSVPPMPPPGAEWNVRWFDVRKHGRFFDHFLVRRKDDPVAMFAADPGLHRVAHEGAWWLYRRSR